MLLKVILRFSLGPDTNMYHYMNFLQCISGACYQDVVLVFFYYSPRWAVSIEEPTFQGRPNVVSPWFMGHIPWIP